MGLTLVLRQRTHRRDGPVSGLACSQVRSYHISSVNCGNRKTEYQPCHVRCLSKPAPGQLSTVYITLQTDDLKQDVDLQTALGDEGRASISPKRNIFCVVSWSLSIKTLARLTSALLH